MSKEQIEEMANELATLMLRDRNLMSVCEKFYNAGYRKQIIGEWRSELVKKCDWKGKKHDYYQPNSCSLCHEAVVKRTPFCPNCGAKMKGGAE